MNKAKNASNVDPMFTCVAKTKSSFNIWRVEVSIHFNFGLIVSVYTYN